MLQDVVQMDVVWDKYMEDNLKAQTRLNSGSGNHLRVSNSTNIPVDWKSFLRFHSTEITSRLDYCNSLINNIAKEDLSKLQRVQNCLARAPRFSPSLPLLKQLHWLPVNYRIKFKLSTLTYRALAIHQPPYLASLLHFSNVPRQLTNYQQKE